MGGLVKDQQKNGSSSQNGLSVAHSLSHSKFPYSLYIPSQQTLSPRDSAMSLLSPVSTAQSTKSTSHSSFVDTTSQLFSEALNLQNPQIFLTTPTTLTGSDPQLLSTGNNSTSLFSQYPSMGSLDLGSAPHYASPTTLNDLLRTVNVNSPFMAMANADISSPKYQAATATASGQSLADENVANSQNRATFSGSSSQPLIFQPVQLSEYSSSNTNDPTSLATNKPPVPSKRQISNYPQYNLTVDVHQNPYDFNNMLGISPSGSFVDCPSPLQTWLSPNSIDSANPLSAQSSDSCGEPIQQTPSGTFLCSICNMEFANRRSLSRHRKQHSGVKPFECRLCNRKFYRSDTLKRHEASRMHHDKKKYLEYIGGLNS